MFHCLVRIPGLDGLLTTGGYYREDLVRTSDGWKIQRLVEDNRWMEPSPPTAV
jgi:hypothetical protein